jgi:hypothetical protein
MVPDLRRQTINAFSAQRAMDAGQFPDGQHFADGQDEEAIARLV